MFSRKLAKTRCRNLRNNMTKAERFLWEELRKKQISGFRFRRQFSISRFIVDFYCLEAKLVIEVDGGYHKFQRDYDHAREEIIKSFNIDILRFTNEEVIENWEIVNLEIDRKLNDSGLIVQEKNRIEWNASKGIAVK